MEDKGKEILKSFKRHVSQRAMLEKTWEEAYEYTYPIRGQGFQGSSNDPFSNAQGARNDQAKLYDSTGTDACRLLASSMISGLTPANEQWFSLSIPNVADAYLPRTVRQWLQQGSETLFSMIHSSNYNAEAYELFQDISVVGQAGLFIELDETTGRLHFENWHLSTLFIADSTKAKKVDTVYRRLQMAVAEAAAKFGASNLPEEQKKTLEKDETNPTKYSYVHCIRPRFRNGKRASGKQAKAMPFESIYVCEKSGEVVFESGFQEFPVVIPRWSVVPGTEYGVGPLNDALPDLKTLNKIVEMMLMNGEMAIAGTFVVAHDGIVNPSTIRIGPRKIVFAASTDSIKPLATGGNWRVAEGEVVRLQAQIKRVMMSDELSPSQSGVPMTAEEVRTRQQTIRQILGPVFSRLQAEFLNPLIERCFALAFRAGMLGQPPEELAGLPFVPEFKSPLARAQCQDSVASMAQFEASLAQKAQVFGPSVLDVYDADKATQKLAEILNVPADTMRDMREVEQIRKERAEAEAQQAQLEAQAKALNARPSEAAADSLVEGLME